MVTKEQLQAEINALTAQKDQALANANAAQGAIMAYGKLLARMTAEDTISEVMALEACKPVE